ncbi:MAG: hypothetical protein GY861_14760 [bacterium]|nr:hypothetical protein [bacterium]
MSTRKQFLEELKKRGATKEQAMQALQMKREQGTPFDDEPSQAQLKLAGELRQQRPQAIKEAQQQSFREQPVLDQLYSGIGQSMYSTPGVHQMANVFRGDEDPKSDFEAYEKGAEGSFTAGTGEVLGELAMATPAIMATKGMGARNRLALGGLGTAGLHQAQNVQRGSKVDPYMAQLETGLSMAIPGIGGKIGTGLKKAGETIIKSATKLGKKVKGQKVMNSAQVKNYFENYGSWRGIFKSEEKLNAHQAVMGKRFDDIMNDVSKGRQVDIKKATIQARNEALVKAKKGKIAPSEMKKLNKQIDQFEELTQDLLNKEGKIDFKIAQNFKKAELDPMSKWDTPNVLGDINPLVKGQAKASRAVRGKLVKQMEDVDPRLGPLNKEYSQMADVRPFIEQTAERTSANRFLSPQDYATLAVGIGGGGYMAGAGSNKTAIAMALPFLASRAQKSPAVASFLYDLGRGVDFTKTKIPDEVQQLIMQAGRSGFGGQQ